jgi:hypothetical protein
VHDLAHANFIQGKVKIGLQPAGREGNIGPHRAATMVQNGKAGMKEKYTTGEQDETVISL